MYFEVFLQSKVLQAPTGAVPVNEIELDVSCPHLREGEEEDWQWILLLPTVLQGLVDDLGPGPSWVLTDEHLELLGAAVLVPRIVDVDQLRRVDVLATAEVQNKLRGFLVRSLPEVFTPNLLLTVREKIFNLKSRRIFILIFRSDY